MNLFGGERAGVDRAGDQGHRGRRDGAARRPGHRKPGRGDRRRAAQDLGVAQACGRLAAGARLCILRARGPGCRADGDRPRSALWAQDQRRRRGEDRRSCGNDQAIVAQELEKLALYIDASPHSPKELEQEAIDAVGVDSGEGDFLRLADLALIGDVSRDGGRAGAAAGRRVGGDSRVRSLQRRLLMLAPARARIERGERLDAVMASSASPCSGRIKTRSRRCWHGGG